MKNYDYWFWIDFRPEHYDAEGDREAELEFLKEHGFVDWNAGADSPFNDLPRQLVVGDKIHYDPFFEEVVVEDYVILIDGNLVVTDILFAYEDSWVVYIDCYCENYIIYPKED